VTKWSAAEVDGMEITDLNDWIEEAVDHAKAVRDAREAAQP
jgi:hypothetical protein